MRAFNPPALRKQRQVDLCEFKAAVYLPIEFQGSQDYAHAEVCLNKVCE